MISDLRKGEIKRQIYRQGEHHVNTRTVIHNREQILRHSSAGINPADTWSQISALQNWDNTFLWLNHSVCGTLLMAALAN